jgi:hypothetical protein
MKNRLPDQISPITVIAGRTASGKERKKDIAKKTNPIVHLGSTPAAATLFSFPSVAVSYLQAGVLFPNPRFHAPPRF